MAYTYCFCNADNTCIKRTDDDGNVDYVPCAEGNRDYAEYLASGVTADAYVAPPAPPAPVPRTPDEKLAAAGLTLDDLKVLLGKIKT